MNHLSRERSPYLLLHANNPVDWYPWGQEALRKAKTENKPILLSIGYAACHWCHVMMHESFEDNETAELMNQWFINIKVDREERPDLDKIYQLAHQLLTGQPGGWPLTVFLSPDTEQPFFSGTYFPKVQSFGRPAFKSLLSQVAHFYYQRKDAIEKLSQSLSQAFEQISAELSSVSLDHQPLQEARVVLEKNFDSVHGGFGHEPKFPMTLQLENLLQYFVDSRRQDKEMLRMVDHSLTRMAQGGFCDQIGGGFFRYCVDAHWLIPHFEKMLYDNAQLLTLFAQSSLLTKDTIYPQVIFTIYQWLLREMHEVNHGFYSSLNADSEGIEGKFYVWDRQEIAKILTAHEYYVAEMVWGLKQPPNFEGNWHLHWVEKPDPLDQDVLQQVINKLLGVRELRVHPSRDTKILTAWNALLIKALYVAGQIVNQPEMISQAKQSLAFIKNNLWSETELLAAFKDGQGYLPGYLDDYAFLLEALMYGLQNQWDENLFNWMLALAKQLQEKFYDVEKGGFFYTPHEHEPLIYRPKTFYDEALPSGNGVAALCFGRMGHFLGIASYLEISEKTLKSAWATLTKQPSHCSTLLFALREYLHPPTIIILRGESKYFSEWQNIFFQHYLPHHLCFALPTDTQLPEVLQKPVPEKGVAAYICQGQTCQQVIANLSEFAQYFQ